MREQENNTYTRSSTFTHIHHSYSQHTFSANRRNVQMININNQSTRFLCGTTFIREEEKKTIAIKFIEQIYSKYFGNQNRPLQKIKKIYHPASQHKQKSYPNPTRLSNYYFYKLCFTLNQTCIIYNLRRIFIIICSIFCFLQ